MTGDRGGVRGAENAVFAVLGARFWGQKWARKNKEPQKPRKPQKP
jgi:hypothetical protein